MARTYINVPFRDKDVAKEYGAQWDRAYKSWYIPDGFPVSRFDRWAVHKAEEKVDNRQLTALKAAMDAIVETVGEFPGGAPGGPIYAALVERGCSFELFTLIMNSLVGEGRLKRRGQLYFKV